MKLRALGGLDLEGVPLARHKPLLLLCLLALDGPQERGRLATLFWAGASDPRNRLSVALSRLRAAAPGSVGTGGEVVATSVATDVAELEAALARGDAEATRELYVGAFLATSSVRNLGPELEAWVLQRREDLAGRVRELLVREAERAAAEEHFVEAAARAERALAVAGAAPPEPALLVRLHGLLVAGDSSAAAALAREGQELELPMATSRAEARATLRGQRPRGNLPRAVTSFVGRDHELTELGGLLGHPHRPLITLLGPGGIGKTRLALALAEDRAASGAFPGGVYFISCDGLEGGNSVARAVAAAVGRPPGPEETAVDAAAAAIGERPTLLVVDGMEQVPAGATQVAHLLRRCTRLFALVTSHARLELEEESVFPVAGLPVPEQAPALGDVAQHDALRLFVERAQRARLDYQPDAEDVAAMLTVAREVGGAPLGIELAATGVRHASVPAIAATLRAHLDAVASPSRNLAGRHRSLRASFEASWRLLAAKEREALRRLSVFEGGFEVEEEVVEGIAEVPPGSVRALRDVALVQGVPGRRASLHPLVARFAAERLAQDADVHARLRARHADWVLERIERLERAFYGPDHAAAMAALEREEGNRSAAFDWAVAHDGPVAMAMAGALRPFWRFSGRLAQGRALAERSLDAATPGADAEIASARLCAGEMAYRQGAYAAARAHLGEALRHAQRARSAVAAGHVRHVAGLLALAEHRLDDADAQFRRLMEDARSRGDERMEQAGAIGLARVAIARGLLDEPEARLERVLMSARQNGSVAGVAEARTYLAAIARARGDFDAAADHLRAALEGDEALDDRGGVAHTLQQLADLALDRGDLDGAERQYRAILERCRGLGDPPGRAKATHGLGRVAERRGRLRDACGHYGEAARSWLQMGNEAQLRPLLASLARVASAHGRHAIAARLWGAEETLAERLGAVAARRRVDEARTGVNVEAYAAERRRGRALSPAEAVEIGVRAARGASAR